MPVGMKQLGNDPGDLCRRLGTDYGDRADASIAVSGKDGIENCFNDRLWPIAGRFLMQIECRLGVDFQNRSSLFAQRSRYVVGDQIDPGNVEADKPGRINCDLSRLRMNAGSDIFI